MKESRSKGHKKWWSGGGHKGCVAGERSVAKLAKDQNKKKVKTAKLAGRKEKTYAR